MVAFDPASLGLTLYMEQAYSASPWTSTASAGLSGGRTLTEATNPPTAGTVLGGKASAAFNGTTQKLTLNALVGTDLWTVSTGGIFFLVKGAAGQAAAGGNATADACLVAESGADLAIGVNSSGFALYGFDVGDKQINLPATVDGATWHAVFMRWSAGLLEGGVNAAALSSTACGNIASLAGNIKFGCNYNASKFFPGEIRAIATWATKPSDTDRANIRAYWNTTYGISV